ncbi:hypothetical protein QA641_04020 [Bradyrhizobium sp. CB1650]|uniref:hypothetical protein n=1 Tax=Bradyrhizobium sp. CB1650 TaxID=3039153 RepID=UPI002435BD53|nr:hypothetical protein [Bradyrhizobium sp. CB1650]WGD53114.1 hypothetical protein QA641_04020 [Bradyrhizobium sp. CB1650]
MAIAYQRMVDWAGDAAKLPRLEEQPSSSLCTDQMVIFTGFFISDGEVVTLSSRAVRHQEAFDDKRNPSDSRRCMRLQQSLYNYVNRSGVATHLLR